MEETPISGAETVSRREPQTSESALLSADRQQSVVKDPPHDHTAQPSHADSKAHPYPTNAGGRRHSHAAGHTKSKSMMRSASSHAFNHPVHTSHNPVVHQSNSAAGARIEHRSRPSRLRRTRTKFVIGAHDHEDDEYEDDTQEAPGETTRRTLEHGGHHSHHLQRHKHGPYPQQHHPHIHPQHHRQPLHQQSVPHRAHKAAHHENQDAEHGPRSESIPNNSERDTRRSESESVVQTQGSKKSAVDTGATPLLRPMESLALLDAAAPQGHLSAQQKEQLQPSLVQTSEHAGISLSSQDRGSRLQTPESLEHHTVVKDIANLAPSTVDSLSVGPSDTASDSNITANESTLKQLSKRLSRLLNPSLSATSLPSLTKVIPHPVLTVLSPSSAEEDSSGHASAGSSSSSRLKEKQRAFASPAQELFSQFLSPSTASMHAHSRSQMNLRGSYSSSAAGSGGPNSSSAYAGLHHIRRGSSASMAADHLSSTLKAPAPRPRSIHGFMTSPPRLGKDGAMFLISRFLPPSPSHAPPLSSSAPKISARPQSPSGERPSQAASSMRQRRLPASLRMTSSTAFDSELSHEGQSGQMTPTSPMSDYSSNEGPVSVSGQGQGQGSDSSPPLASSSFAPGPWIPEESMSRTQQKLLLQRASSQDNLDQEEMTRRGKMQREMERIQREYRGIRLTYDPILESLTRCYAKRERELKEGLGQGGQGSANVDRLNPSHSLSSLSVSSM
ncbi:hypothetical protein BGZ72_000912 [Mortierella alpina]|nr:hypothetical protein BGZ72_000912 [Mortierella alpina]